VKSKTLFATAKDVAVVIDISLASSSGGGTL